MSYQYFGTLIFLKNETALNWLNKNLQDDFSSILSFLKQNNLETLIQKYESNQDKFVKSLMPKLKSSKKNVSTPLLTKVNEFLDKPIQTSISLILIFELFDIIFAEELPFF